MLRTRLPRFLLLASLLVASACGGDDGHDADDPDGGPGGTVDADPGHAADAGPDADVLPPLHVTSNLPNASFEPTVGSSPDLVLLSASYVQRTLTSGVPFQTLLARIENRGAVTLCLVQMKAELHDAAGQLLVSSSSFAEGPAFQRGGGAPTPCIAPGKHGVIFATTDAPSLEPGDIRQFVFTLSGVHDASAVPHPLAPDVVGDHVISAFGSDWAVAGTLKGKGGAIHNVDVTVYPRTASGLVLDPLTDHDFDALAPGQSFAFETSSNDGTTFEDYDLFTEFAPGAAP
jgi:hypothetical protein